MRLLLVEDDITLGEGLRDFLETEGYVVDWAKSISQAKACLTEPYDIWLFDWNLPDGSSVDLLTNLRARGQSTPTILLTARDLLSDRIRGLDSGADDYMVKPFEPEELSARLRSLIRRQSGGKTRIQFGEVEVDLEAKAVWKSGKVVDLTAREWSVLEALLRRRGRIVSRADIESLVLGFDSHDISSNAIDVHIFKLRHKLGKTLIETVRGLGYRISPTDLTSTQE